MNAPDFSKFPRKVNLGCGLDHRAGYLNVDLHGWHKPDVVADVRVLEGFPENHFDEALANDVLEHLPRVDSRAVLARWGSILRTGGLLRVRVPSLLGVADLLARPENQPVPMQELLIQNLFGTQAYSGDFHYTAFTEPVLRAYLADAGMEVVEWALFEHWLYDVVARKVSAPRDASLMDQAALLAVADAGEFVRQAFVRILGREPDAAGGGYFRGALESGQLTRSGVLLALRASDEAKIRGA